jgi:hypothetical protein
VTSPHTTSPSYFESGPPTLGAVEGTGPKYFFINQSNTIFLAIQGDKLIILYTKKGVFINH